MLEVPHIHDLVKKLLSGFERNIPAYPNGRTNLRDCTSSVLETMRQEGNSQSFHVYCSDGTRDHSEFLLDVVWFNPQTARPDLIAESEWGDTGAVAYDFEKLIWVKARLKLMVCDPQSKRHELLHSLNEKLRRYPDHLGGDQYHVLNLNGTPRGGAPRLYSWSASESGRHEDAELTEMHRESPFVYVLGSKYACSLTETGA
jgi:hypothetical protein